MRRTLILLASLALPAAAGAQGGAPRPSGPVVVTAPVSGEVTGVIVDEGGQPVPTASVAVRRARDSALVNGAVVREDGAFLVGGLPPGRYVVRVRALGYAPVVRTVALTPDSSRVAFGRIALARVAAQLSGVTVQGQNAEAVLAPDRNSYSMKDMPAASSGTAVDVLRHVPGVEVDADNKVSLRGNQGVVVQINGRPSPMRGEQLGNFLAQLPANMVSRVEVVPNPSAKDDPDGMAGIVNLVLKQNADLGRSGGLTFSGGSTGQVNGSGNLGYQGGPLTLFGSYGYMQDHREMTGFTNRENLVASPGTTYTFLNADTRGEFSPKSHTATANAEYKLRPRDALSTNLVYNDRRNVREADSYYRELDADRTVTGRSDQGSNGTSRDASLDYSLSYKHTVKPQRNETSAELRLNRATTDVATVYSVRDLLADGTPASPSPELQRDALDETRYDWTFQSDLTRPVGERGKIETGYKGTLRSLDNDFGVGHFNDAQGAYVSDPARSSAFDYRDGVHAVYGVLSQSVGKVDLQGGLRLEQAASRFDLATTGERFDNDYRSVYPSGLVAYNVDEKRQLKASYSKRVNRPDMRQMNPFGFREDALNLFRGNPYLKPEYTHAMELGYQQTFSKGTLQLSPFFRHTVDAVRVTRTVDDRGVATTTFQNVATSDSYGADANGSLRLGRLTGFGGVNVYRQVTDGSNLSSDVSNNTVGWSARANGTFKATPRLDLQAFVMYRAPMTTEQGRIRSMSMTNLAVRQKLRGDKASVTLRVVDPFNTMRFGYAGGDTRVYQETLRRFGARGAFLAFNYSYGQQPRLRPQRTPDQQQPTDIQMQPGVGPA